ncbi:MAG: hypothetical protein ACRD11_01095 [Terriglobia bacterium]
MIKSIQKQILLFAQNDNKKVFFGNLLREGKPGTQYGANAWLAKS